MCIGRELLWTLSDAELNLLEKSLCSIDDVDCSSTMLAELSGLPPELLLSCDTNPPSYSQFTTDLYAREDLSDTDEDTAGDDLHGLMVHSESTMTGNETIETAVTSAAAAAATTLSSSSVLTESEAHRLHYSKSWPQSADGHTVGCATSAVANTVSAVAVYGNQRYNFNLPTNTSVDRLYSVTDAAGSDGRFGDQNIIYLSSPMASEQQITYITDELCRIFCTDTASLREDDDNNDDDADDIEVLLSDVVHQTSAQQLVVSESVEMPWDVTQLPAVTELEMSALQQRCLEHIDCEFDAAVMVSLDHANRPTSLEATSDHATSTQHEVIFVLICCSFSVLDMFVVILVSCTSPV